MNNVLITGATGLVGRHLLRLLINEPSVGDITAPTRRRITDICGINNPCDPQLSDALNSLTSPVDTVFCCLGSTLREAGNKESFAHVDYTLVVETGQTGLRLGARQMVVVSAMGASADSLFFYNRVKGQTEQSLMGQNWPQLTIVRPSMLLGSRDKPRPGEQLAAPLFRLLPERWKAIRASDVARAMLISAHQPSAAPVSVLNSAQLRRLAGQFS